MERPAHHLQALLGEPAFVALAEAFGGRRLYVPTTIRPESELARAIGLPAARRLSARLAPDVVVVPLAREIRARHYIARGETIAAIAIRFGMSERGVKTMVKRLVDQGVVTRPPPNPLPLFPED